MKYTKDPKFIGKMFDDISPTYDRLNHLLSGMQDVRWRKHAVKYLMTRSDNYYNILDLASGSGDLALAMLKLNPQNIYSADLSSEMLKLNEKKVNSNRNIVLQANAQYLPFEDNYFDLIGIGFGVRNFQKLALCIKEIARVLKPGGRFLTIEMFKSRKNNLTSKTFKLYFRKVLPKIGKLVSKSDYAYDYLFDSVDNFLNVKDYEKLLKAAGMKVEYEKNNFLSIVHTVIAVKE